MLRRSKHGIRFCTIINTVVAYSCAVENASGTRFTAEKDSVLIHLKGIYSFSIPSLLIDIPALRLLWAIVPIGEVTVVSYTVTFKIENMRFFKELALTKSDVFILVGIKLQSEQ